MIREKFFSYYLAGVTILGMLFTYIVTFRYGAGLSTDGARYLSTAENLINGRGFYEYLGVPLTQFPPIYSIIIAIIGFLTQADVFVAAQYINLATFGLLIWLAGKFFYKMFPDEILFAYMGSVFFATSISLIRIASNILSDLLFLTITIVFLISATNFIENPSRRSLLALGVLCAVSPLLRYAGLVHIITISILLLIQKGRGFLKRIVQAVFFCAITSLPTLLWVYLHNYLLTGILFGVRLPPNPQGNLDTTIEKAMHWFIPYSVTDRLPEWAIIALVSIILLSGNSLGDWKGWALQITNSKFLPNLVFLALYAGVLIFNVSYSEVRWPFMDRIHIIILPSLIALVFLTIRTLTPTYLRRYSSKNMQIAAITLFILWLAYPLNNVQKYLRSAFYNGEISEYNLYNTRALNESGIREFIESLSITAEDKIYSNYEPLAWFYTRRTILKLPQGAVGPEPPDPEEVLLNYPGWPGNSGGGFVIWMKKLGFKEYVLAPEQLTSKAHFDLLYIDKQGDVYRITPK